MEEARRQRMVQLETYEKYMSGEPTEFTNHQFTTTTLTYDPSIFDTPRVDFKLRFADKWVYLHAAVVGDTDTIEELVKKGVDPNETNADGLTALHTSCIENHLRLASTMLTLGANVNARDDDGWTPLHAAAACGHWRIVNVLLDSGADIAAINDDGDFAIDLAEGDKLPFLKDAMEQAQLDEAKQEELRTKPLSDFQEQVDAMIKSNANLDELDEQGASPLHVAVCNGWLEPTKALIQCGADVNLKDRDGNTPMHLAVFFMQFKCVEALGDAGASLTLKNNNRQIPNVLTEDPAMLRLLRSIEHKEKRPIVPSAGAKQQQASNTLKRKSLAKGGTLAKKDTEREGKRASSVYEEINFLHRDRRASEFDERDRQLAQDAVEEAAAEAAAEEAAAAAAASSEQPAQAETSSSEQPESTTSAASQENQQAPAPPATAEASAVADKAPSVSTEAKPGKEGGGGGCCIVQ